ncbi:uncharacterized protein LOC129283225 [Lytechinus pictus]|uniref:uncharacterized protein LOC129283225 n=1 Tax=Lytechinus pictus TaxID=7653 RepID=UPI0030B9E049
MLYQRQKRCNFAPLIRSGGLNRVRPTGLGHNISNFSKMRKELFCLVAVLAVAWSKPTETQCDVNEVHAVLGTPRMVEESSNSPMIPDFDLSISDVDEGFLPEIEYAVNLKSNPDLFEEFVVTAHNLDPDCVHGTMIDKYDIGTPDEDCPHVIRNAIVTDMRRVSFSWKAPQCGCVTLRATVKSGDHVYSDSSSEKGALTTEVCLLGMIKSDEEEEMGEDESMEEEPLYDDELYGNIERLCEEGNFRGPVLPSVITECCQLPVHQRRMCLVRLIPGEENDMHRLDTFCSKMAGNFFEGHPVLATAEGVRRCCELTSDSDRMLCLSEEKRTHYDEICGLSVTRVNGTMDRLPGRNCCRLQGDLRYNCMEKKALRENQKRRLEEKRTLKRKMEKVKRLCNAVDKTPEGDRDVEDYQTCCMVDDVDDALACFRETERNNFDSLCKKQASRFENGKKERVHPCCSSEDEARYECFLVKRSTNQQMKNNSTRRPEANTQSRGSWMQRMCTKLRKEGADETLITCCKQSTFLDKKRCMDKRQNAVLAQICNNTNVDVSYVIVEGENFNAAKTNLHPEHECCMLGGEERISCIRTMRISLSKLRRQKAPEKSVQDEAPREKKGQRWMKEEIRQNEAICTAVREDVDLIDEQVVRCCEEDGEGQRECLAALRRNHFTAVCNTDELFQIDIFNTIVRTEDPINAEHRCCMRQNADIRAACFSRVDRQVAMLSFSPPIIEKVQNIREDLLDIAEVNRLTNVCDELKTAPSSELRGRWPMKKCCRFKNDRKFPCIRDTAKRLADQSCDGPPPRVYFPVGFYGEYIPDDFEGPFLDPSHPCCSLAGDMRHECIKENSMAVLGLRIPITQAMPMVEFFKEMPPEMRFDIDHQNAICQAAEDFKILYADPEANLDVDLNQLTGIQAELQELQDLLAEEIMDEEEDEDDEHGMHGDMMQELMEQNEEEEEEDEEEEEEDRRRKRRHSDKYRRPTAKKVRQSYGRTIYEVDSLVHCCEENSVTQASSCMTNAWLQLLNDACFALPDNSQGSSAGSVGLDSVSESAQPSNNVRAPAPIKFGGRGDIETSMSITDSTMESNTDEENFRKCCGLYGDAQLECFQIHFSPDAPSSQIENEGSSNPSTGDSPSVGILSESEGSESEGSEGEESEGEEDEEGEEFESGGEDNDSLQGAEEPQEQTGNEMMETDFEEEEEEEEGEEEEEEEEEDMEGSVPQGVMENEGEQSESNVQDFEEGDSSESSQGEEEPQEQTGNEMMETDFEEEEEEEEEGEEEEEDMEGSVPQGVMENEGEQSESNVQEFEEGDDSESSQGEEEEEVPEEDSMPALLVDGGSEGVSESESSDGSEDEEANEDTGGGWWGGWWTGDNNPQEQEQLEEENEDMEGSVPQEVMEVQEEQSESNVPESEGEQSESSQGEEEEEEEEEDSVPVQLEETDREGEGSPSEEDSGYESESSDGSESESSDGSKSESSDGSESESSDGSESESSDGSESESSDGSESESSDGSESESSDGSESESSDGSESESSDGSESESSDGSESESSDGSEDAEEIDVKANEDTGGWWGGWWSGNKKPQEQEQLEEPEEDRRKKRDIWSWMLLDGEESEQMESEGQESEGQESEGNAEPQEQNADAEEEEEEEEEEDEEDEDSRRKRSAWNFMDGEESEGQDGEHGAQEQVESEGQESEAEQDGGWWWNWWTDNNEPQTQEQQGETEEEDDEEDEDSRRRREIMSDMGFPRGEYKQRKTWLGNNHLETAMHNTLGSSKRNRHGSKLGKLFLLKLLFKNEMVEGLCPAVEAADDIHNLISRLSDLIEPEVSVERRERFRGSNAILQELKACCALNVTEEKVECISGMTQSIVDGICDIQEKGFRPRPDTWGKKNMPPECCNVTDGERYSCAREYLVPTDELQVMIDEAESETKPAGILQAIGNALGRVLNLDEDETSSEIDDHETAATNTTSVEISPWDNVRVKMMSKMCCQVGSLTGALLGESGAVTCESGAEVYSQIVEESMKSKCIAAYTKCCSSRPA